MLINTITVDFSQLILQKFLYTSMICQISAMYNLAISLLHFTNTEL